MQATFGFVNAFKPPGPSSAAFGNWVKRVSGAAAVGHWGTLDPSASGVLVLACGKATKLLPLLPHARKQYVFDLVVGQRTETGDATGRIIASAHVPDDWAARLESVAASLTGPQTQIPPMYSAVKVSGRPLYKAARKGLDVPRAPRVITIHELRVISHEAHTARLFVECDAGTYVRVVCEELGRGLGLPARMGALLRVASGPFVLRDCVRPDQIEADVAGWLIDPLDVLPQARIELDDRRALRFEHGNDVQLATSDQPPASAERSSGDKTEVLVTRDGAIIGCGYLFALDGTTQLAPTRVFP